MKPTSDLDTEVMLSDVIGPRELASSVDIYTQTELTKDSKKVVMIKPKRRLKGSIWSQLNQKIREWSGFWDSRERSWRLEV